LSLYFSGIPVAAVRISFSPDETSPKEHFSLTSAGYPSIFIIPYLLGS
jgi:hypothetical protein